MPWQEYDLLWQPIWTRYMLLVEWVMELERHRVAVPEHIKEKVNRKVSMTWIIWIWPRVYCFWIFFETETTLEAGIHGYPILITTHHGSNAHVLSLSAILALTGSYQFGYTFSWPWPTPLVHFMVI